MSKHTNLHFNIYNSHPREILYDDTKLKPLIEASAPEVLKLFETRPP